MRFAMSMLVSVAFAGVVFASTLPAVVVSLDRSHPSQGVWTSLATPKDVSGAIHNDASSTRVIELFARYGTAEQKLCRVLPGEGMTFKASKCTNLRVAIVIGGMEHGSTPPKASGLVRFLN